MKISLIVTTYNWPEALYLCLKSIKYQSLLPDEVIIADDGSSFETKKTIDTFAINNKYMNIIHSWQEDKGFRTSKSRNKAIAKSNYEYVILIDGDIILHKDFIKDHLRFSKKNTYIQGCRSLLKNTINPSLFDVKGHFIFLRKGIRNRINALRCIFLANLFNFHNKKIRGIKSCNMSFFKEDCIKVNGFNEDFIGWGREDTEFAIRLYNNNIVRQNVKFAALSFHIPHPKSSRAMLETNDRILQNTIEKEMKFCKNGIDKYLSADSS
ncbi:MAG: family 2 glycosyl transferase [Desulfobacterales bacterium]|nr:MAG: family 2 glycosyl transferase [Desulfobacterales bacterium]